MKLGFVVAKWNGLSPKVGLIVTNMSVKEEGVIHFNSGSDTAREWIKEGKYALNWTWLSSKRIVFNEVRLWFFVLAYNPVNFFNI